MTIPSVRKEWQAEADKQTLETLPAFLKKLAEYEHDYNTICYAVACAAVAAAKSMDRTPNGGITGFQAGAIMWEFIGHWMLLEGKPLRLTDYSDMLYPQYDDKFNTITPETWEYLQKKAAENLANEEKHTSPVVSDHWRSIVAGQVPFDFTVSRDG